LSIYDKIQKNLSNFLNKFGPINISNVDIQVIDANIANKYCQMTYIILYIQTCLAIFLDDHIFLPRSFLDFIIPIFENIYISLYRIKKIIYYKNPIAYSF
jgi:hypothetical protein